MADAAADPGPDPFETIAGFVAPIASPPAAMGSLKRYLACAASYDKQRSAQGIILAYYIRMFATQLAITKFREDESCKTFMFAMLQACENCKPIVHEVTDGDELRTYKIIEDAAVKFFHAADRADRAGKCTKATAQAFMKASILFEALTEVMRDADNDPKMLELDNYAKNKAAYILKCLREGTTPQPGPAAIGGNDGATEPQSAPAANMGVSGDWSAPTSAAVSAPDPAVAPSGGGYDDPYNGAATQSSSSDFGMPSVGNDYDLPPVPASTGSDFGLSTLHSLPTAPPAPAAVQRPSQPAPMIADHVKPYAHTPPVVAPIAIGASSFHPKASLSVAEEKEAAKCAKFAISALAHADTQTAVTQLLDALKIICD